MFDGLDYDEEMLKEVFEGVGIERNPPEDYPLYSRIKTHCLSDVIRILEEDPDKYDINLMSSDNTTHTIYTSIMRYKTYTMWDSMKKNYEVIRSKLEEIDEHVNGRYAVSL